MIQKYFLLIAFGITCFQALAEGGCTDPEASNYDAAATFDDGSCCYQNTIIVEMSAPSLVYFYSDDVSYYLDSTDFSPNTFCVPDGCYGVFFSSGYFDVTISVFVNGTMAASGNAEDSGGYEGEFTFGINTAEGCTDILACNYDPNANCNNGSCNYNCLGCTDPNSPNYNDEATVDDGSCCSSSNWLTFSTPDYEGEYSSFEVFTYWNVLVATGPGGTAFCLPDGCYIFKVVIDDEVVLTTGVLTDANGNAVVIASEPGIEASTEFGINAEEGCADPGACNYNPFATCANSNLCNYDCLGCTDPEANNYDPEATIDDGSCCDTAYTLVADGSFNWGAWSYYTNDGGNGTYPQNNTVCLSGGCYSFDMYAAPEEIINWELIDGEGNVLYSGVISNGYGGQYLEINVTSGCVDIYACNFNPEANCLDYSLCDYSCLGCTDPEAPNYDPEATIDNGSCCLDNWYNIEIEEEGYWSIYSNNGWTSVSGMSPVDNGFCLIDGCFTVTWYPLNLLETDAVVTIIDSDNNVIGEGTYDPMFGGISFTVLNGAIEGCIYPTACNYDPLATCSSPEMCDYSCYGCIDPEAPNFDPDATADDGSCCYDEWYTIELGAPATWYVSSQYGAIYSVGQYPEQNGFCLSDECFQFGIWAFDGTEIPYTIYNEDGEIAYSGISNLPGLGQFFGGDGSVIGCSDPLACNYNALANCGDYTICDYGCYGCTDPNAPNYEPSATIDNGLCCYTGWFTLDVSGEAYWYVTSTSIYSGGFFPSDNGFCLDVDCFSVYVYPLGIDPVSFTVLDPDGNVVGEGFASPGFYGSISISLSGNVAGCSDPSACNYNPEANCEDGSCSYYCGGCTDPGALNYDIYAQYDNGSCFYTLEPPMMGMIVIPDEENMVYYVQMNMIETGNGSPYIMSFNYNSEMMIVEQEGQYLAGPFPCDQDVVMSLQSMTVGLETYFISDPLVGVCAEVNSVEEATSQSSLVVFPNPADGSFVVSGILGNRVNISLVDIYGRKVFENNYVANTGKVEINENAIASGIYHLVVNDGGTISSTRISIR